MDKVLTEKYNRGRRLIKELNEVLDRYQKLQFYIDTDQETDKATKIVLETQARIMREYINILTKRLENTEY
ncbi:hypothetical protein HKO22_03045 [Peptoniphilus sp. AGMB00490]|uniref:Uncharacterized protein n=1 Tax=Peptoniphilus faecalis TaxID=2731255 RepID=A0A848RG81_9FIRM|nr:hypothetical protein [Peptoniphilus faecalis]NMW84721.1 hypothetical protein [Peptoniphilus faecalis]